VIGALGRYVLFWFLALLLAVFGLACVAFPLVMLGPWDPGAHLLDDTRAAYGAGRGTGITISRVLCTRLEFGHDGGSTGRGVHSFEYDSEFTLHVPSHQAPVVEPDWASMTPEQINAYQTEQIALYSARLRELERGPGPNDPPDAVFRRLPRSAQGRPVPTLRQFTPDGVPPRYGLVWADGGLGARWFRWAWETTIFWGFAWLCFLAIRAYRRKLITPSHSRKEKVRVGQG
jgi:hypothetical protein